MTVTGARPVDVSGFRSSYDPWVDLQRTWPHVRVVIEPMRGNLLGEVREDGGLIALRAGTTLAQRRCTLAHELIHLERGIRDCGPWLLREEQLVHAEAARRLVTLEALCRATRSLGRADQLAELAQVLDVDSETLQLRLTRLDRRERARVRNGLRGLGSVWNLA